MDNVMGKLTQQQLKEIALRVYDKGQRSSEMNVQDVIDELKKEMLSAIMNGSLYREQKSL